jgi:transglutaminase-like putative cysteine protease
LSGFTVCVQAAQQKGPGAKAEEIEFNIHYDFTVSGKTSKIRFIGLIPRTLPDRQKIVISYSPKPTRVFTNNMNRYAEYIFLDPEKKFRVTITGRAKLFGCDLATARKMQKKRPLSGPNFDDFLQTERYIDAHAFEILQAAKNIHGDREISVVRGIYNYVIETMEYGEYGEESRGALNALRQKKGDCSGYADLFVALCRAKNIPAKVIAGYTTGISSTPKHTWAEAYLKGYGWVPFDPTIGDQEDLSVRRRRFHTLERSYVYLTHIRNDEILDNHSYYAWWWWGDKNEVKDSIKFRYLTKTSGDKTSSQP